MLDINTSESNDEKTNKTIKIYIRIYKIFFKYIFFIIAIIISLIISYFMINNNSQAQNNNLSNNQSLVLASKQNFEKQQKIKISNKNYNIKIIGGEIAEKDNTIKANDSLILLGGIVLPRLIMINTQFSPKQIEYFLNENYDKSELENFINNTILNKEADFFTKNDNNLSQIDGSITNTFSLNCLSYKKLYNQVCNYYINRYVDNFFYYDISKDYVGFKSIIDSLPNKKDKICSNIKKYILYSKDTRISKNIFEDCGSEQITEIQDINSFIQITNEIENKYISNVIYSNKFLNYYKLLSSQQIIFGEFVNGKIPTERIISYLDFLGTIIKSDGLGVFYTDESYRFNNYFISDQINKFDDYSDEDSKRKIYTIIQKINSINYGNKIENIPGLENQIKNKTIIKKEIIDTNSNTENPISKIEILSSEIEKSSYLIINTKKIEGNTIKINGYIKMEESNQKELINTNLELTYNGQNFIVSKIQIANIKDVNNLVNKFISDQKKSLPETYEYLKETLGFYTSTNTQTGSVVNLCDKIKENIEGENIKLIACSNKEISINNNNINYKFTYNNYIITRITISDSNIEKDINDSFGRIKTNEENLIKTLINILTYKDTVNFKTKYIDLETVEKIEKNIGPILEFAQSGNKLIFETNIKGIDFIINYNKEKKELGPIYFKNMLINTRPLIIKNIYIKLLDNEETRKFKTSPLNYIKDKDKSAYFLYQQVNK